MESIGIVVGGKGRGSNMERLILAAREGEFQADVRCVIAPHLDLPAVEIAQSHGIQVRVAAPGDDEAMVAGLADCTLVCLAGFLRKLPDAVLAAHPERVINIHPALLPKFGGKGMYGMHVHRAVVEAQERESGCTVHFVTPHYDEGQVIVQVKCALESGMSPEDVASRVLQCEMAAYPLAVKILLGR